jgi:hypothetical protein
VTLHLARDRRHRKSGELATAAGVVALDGVQQTDGSGLYEIVMLGATAVVAVRQRLDQGEVQVYQPIPGSRIAICPIRTQ